VAKLQTYKFINPGSAAAASPVVTAAKTQTLAFNRIGSTVSGIGLAVQDLEKIALLQVKDVDKRAILERRQKRREADAAAEESQELKKVNKGKVTKQAEKKTKKKAKGFGWVTNLLQPLGNILLSIGTLAITKETLEWFGDEKNIEKLVTFIDKTKFVFEKLFGWASTLVGTTLDGFSDLVDPEGDFFTKISGVGKIMLGLIGLKYLMNPFSLIGDIIGLVDLLGRGKPDVPDKPRDKPRSGPDADKPRKPTATNPSGADPDLDGPNGRVRASAVKDRFGDTAEAAYKKVLKERGDDAARVFLGELENTGGNVAKAQQRFNKYVKKGKFPKIEPPKPGFFSRIASGTADAFGAVKNRVVKGLQGLPDWAGKQYDNLSKAAKAGWENTVKASEAIKSKGQRWASAAGEKFKSAKNWVADGGKAFLSNMGDKAKNFFLEKVLTPLKPIIDPIATKAKQIGQGMFDMLMKIPGAEKGLGVLKSKGISGFESIATAGSKLGKRASTILPVIGGLVNLAFAYDRAANGDSIGALIEGTSGILDIAGLATAGAGNVASMLLDGYMFIRDFVPQLQQGEEAVVDAVGARGLKTNIDNLLSKLPNIGEIINTLTGKTQTVSNADELNEDSEQPLFLGGVVKGVKNAFGGVGKAVSGVMQSPVGQMLGTAASFIPGAAPIMAGINTLATGNPMSMLGMIPGVSGIMSQVGNFMNGPIGNITSNVLGGNFMGAATTGLSMLNPALGQLAGSAMSGGFNPMNMVNSLASLFGMGGIFKSMVGGASNEIASTLGVSPNMISGAIDTGKQVLSGEQGLSAQYAMQQVLEFVPIPMIIDKLVPIPTAVPINNSQPIVEATPTALTQRQ
jgi:hypothetical protein